MRVLDEKQRELERVATEANIALHYQNVLRFMLRRLRNETENLDSTIRAYTQALTVRMQERKEMADLAAEVTLLSALRAEGACTDTLRRRGR